MRKLGLNLIMPQIIFVILIALAWWHVSTHDMIGALLGGFAVILPAFYFSQRFFGHIHTQSPSIILRAFYVGEFFKLVISVILMLICVKVFKVALLPLLAGFIGANLGTWFTPFFALKRMRAVT
jgi:F0F1-type ATP synthase assembly protein I